ncbi:DUF6221 family protein [Streptomyces goshikiensis]|uniref:DUF6221 family protein n=1 Tax=Streptomyces goshikiensis TaxID=1942 RepID=UPI0036C6B652
MDAPLLFLSAMLDEDERAAHTADSLRDEPVDALRVRYEPERVLREVAAKRRMLDRHTPRRRNVAGQDGRVAKITVCDWDNDDWPCADVLDLASVYADHPGYQAACRP